MRTFHQEWPDRIPGDEHGDVEYALTQEPTGNVLRTLRMPEPGCSPSVVFDCLHSERRHLG